MSDDAEVLDEVAERYGYTLCADNLWREMCVPCKGATGKASCEICSGVGFIDEGAMTDESMWQYVWDRRDSEAEDMAR